jgi:hypothetical protein
MVNRKPESESSLAFSLVVVCKDLKKRAASGGFEARVLGGASKCDDGVRLYLVAVPPYLSKSPEQLLVPQEAVKDRG